MEETVGNAISAPRKYRNPAVAGDEPVVRFWPWLLAIAAFALVLRLGMRAAYGTETYWLDGYRFFFDLAAGLARGEGYGFDGVPTAFRVPGYPLFVAAITGGERHAWLLIGAQALPSTGSVVLAALLARRFYGALAGLLGGVIAALLPYQAWHDTAFQETGLLTFLATAAIVAIVALQDSGRARWGALAGLILGAAILVRATMLPFAVLILIWLVLAIPKARRGALLGAALMGAVLAPWLGYAKEVTGRYGFGTEFGMAIYAGNHPLTFADYPDRSIDLSRLKIFDLSRLKIFAALTPAEQAELAKIAHDEPTTSDWYLRKAMINIAADPGTYAIGALRKLWAGFGPLPSPSKHPLINTGYALTWTPVLILALIGLWQRREDGSGGMMSRPTFRLAAWPGFRQ
jgi:4-amino-4-deoxy-L-arabinose transferase-like glycosyltransferase